MLEKVETSENLEKVENFSSKGHAAPIPLGLRGAAARRVGLRGGAARRVGLARVGWRRRVG